MSTPQNAESVEVQWAVRAENGVTGRASEDVARAAVTEGGYTLGPDQSPIVAALTRTSAADEWQEFDHRTPPGERTCPTCHAGLDTDTHHAECVAPLDQLDGGA